MQVNVKELTCIPGVMHLELVLMIVLVLQSFLAVSDTDSFSAVLTVSILNQDSLPAVSTALTLSILTSTVCLRYTTWLKL